MNYILIKQGQQQTKINSLNFFNFYAFLCIFMHFYVFQRILLHLLAFIKNYSAFFYNMLSIFKMKRDKLM